MLGRPFLPSLRRMAARTRIFESLERRPIGTNGYVSSWGAITGVCPPKGC